MSNLVGIDQSAIDKLKQSPMPDNEAQDLFLRLFHPYVSGLNDILDRLDDGEHLTSLFCPNHCRVQMEALGMVNVGEKPSEIALTWLREGEKRGASPSPVFVADDYHELYKDVLAAGVPPLQHFLHHGLAEGRSPSKRFVKIFSRLRPLSAEMGPRIFLEFFSQMPIELLAVLDDERRRRFMLQMVHAKVIEARLHRDLDASEQDLETVLWRHVVGGYGEAPISVLFNAPLYRENWKSHLDEHRAALAEHYEKLSVDEDYDGEAPIVPRSIGQYENPLLHWVVLGHPARVSSTNIFDSDYYSETYKDLRTWKTWIFDHYVMHGINERRNPSRYFAANWYGKRYSVPGSESALVHYASVGEANGHFAGPGIDPSRLPLPPSGTPTKLDTLVDKLAEKERRLDTPLIQALVAQAAEIEPLILRPYGHRRIQLPPAFHSAAEMLRAGKVLRDAVSADEYENVVLIPHCRIAGSARVAGSLAKTLREISTPGARTLIVSTELAAFERPDWFGDDIELVILADLAKEAPEVQTVSGLVDLLRGIGPKRVINVNSRLGWDMLVQAAKPLSAEMDFYAYLFCWDLDIHGNKGGYPIRFFQQTFDHLAGVFIDNEVLYDELAHRYCMSPDLASKMHVLHTPAENPYQLDHSEQFATRRAQNRALKFLWSGRFDRQKRFDLVIEIAKMRPEIEFWTYGKMVLADHHDLDLDNLPSNIRMMGTYQHFDDLPIGSCDGVLYTSQWDGLPTILIDVASRGIPLISAAVGGTVDLIRQDTTKPVSDFLNPQAYVDVLDAMLADPDSVTRECRQMIEHTRALCSSNVYAAKLRAALNMGTQHE